MKFISICLLLWLTACSVCNNDPIHVEKSPDGRYEAIAFVRDCGATTGYSTHVSIIKANTNLLNTPGNILIVEGQHPTSVHWTNNRKLIIDVGGKGNVFRQESNIYGIKIDYDKLSEREQREIWHGKNR